MNADVKLLLIALCLLSIFSCAATAQAIPEFLQLYLEEGETSSLMQLDEQHSLVFIGSEITFLAKQDENGNISFIQGTYQLTSILNSYASKNNLSISTILPTQPELTRSLELIDSFNASRIRELDCHSFIGPDNLPCFDKTSCIRSCYSPLCQGMLMGSGEAFLDAIKDFKSNTSTIDANVDSFKQNYPQISSASESELISFITSRLNELSAMDSAAGAVKQNKLFLEETTTGKGGFYFCYAVDYNFSGISQLKSELELLKAKTFIFTDSWGLASGIDFNTKQRIDLLAKKNWCAEQKTIIASTSETFKANASEFQNISEVSFASATLENLRAAFSAECTQKQFDSANSTLSAFRKNLVDARDLLERAAARKQQFYASLEQAKNKVSLLAANASISQQSLQQINASITQLEKEFPLASNYSELELLAVSAKQKNVELDQLATLKTQEITPSEQLTGNDLSWLVIAIIVIIAIALVIYFFAGKKGGRKGYNFFARK